jgi:hypothetical protein
MTWIRIYDRGGYVGRYGNRCKFAAKHRELAIVYPQGKNDHLGLAAFTECLDVKMGDRIAYSLRRRITKGMLPNGLAWCVWP